MDPPEFVLELYGRDLVRVGNLHTFHGRGQYPANLWPQGVIVADRFAVRLAEDLKAPVQAWTQARLNGELPTANVGSVKIIPETWPVTSGSPLAQIGESIELMSATVSPNQAQPGDLIEIEAVWKVITSPNAELTTLVHLGENGQPPLANGDSPPLYGDYPTSIWTAGEVIEDSYTVELPTEIPNDRYPVWIGMYESASFVRLPLTVNGNRQLNDVYLVGWLDISD